jgi:hypothetical protein
MEATTIGAGGGTPKVFCASNLTMNHHLLPIRTWLAKPVLVPGMTHTRPNTQTSRKERFTQSCFEWENWFLNRFLSFHDQSDRNRQFRSPRKEKKNLGLLVSEGHASMPSLKSFCQCWAK